ncbi:MAG: TIGR00730 family Rossman fold protein, partial [Methylococcales bacterium]
MTVKHNKANSLNIIDDLKGDQSWRIFRIISEFTEGFERLSGLDDAISFFGSARLKPDNAYYQQAVEIAELLSQHNFA